MSILYTFMLFNKRGIIDYLNILLKSVSKISKRFHRNPSKQEPRI